MVAFDGTEQKLATEWARKGQLWLRLVLVLTALDELGGEATVEQLSLRLFAPGGVDEVSGLVDELVRRGKVKREGERVVRYGRE